MILFFDTETTGFFKDRLPFDHSDQPGLVQIAASLYDDNRQLCAQISLVVDPERHVPEQASSVHGISTAMAQRLGVKERTAAGIFEFMAARSDLVVAHNAKFDIGVMNCVAARCGAESQPYKHFCTMEAAAPIVNLPPTERMIAAGMDKPKPPKLEECIQHFFGEPLDGAHDALVDVNACARIFFYLVDQGHINIEGTPA